LKIVRAAVIVSALACAQCHDWDQFNRPPVADGSTAGDYRCGIPYALVGVWSTNATPEVQRVRLTDPPTPCAPLPLRSFRRGDTVRAIATLGNRVLVASEAGACILEVSDSAVSETCTQIATNAAVVDAFVRIDPQPRFAISLAIGTSGSISHLLLEDAERKFTEQRPLSSAGLSSLGGAPIRSIMNSPEDPFRLFATREDREELVSARQDNTDRRVHLTATGSPVLYESLGVGPSNSNGSVVAMLPRNAPTQFAMLLNATRFPSSSCSECTRLAHVIPNSIDPRQQIVACDNAGGRPALLLHGTDTSCGTIAAFAAGAHVSRIAIRWPE
jgi:hypothetical protein